MSTTPTPIIITKAASILAGAIGPASRADFYWWRREIRKVIGMRYEEEYVATKRHVFAALDKAAEA